MGAAQFTSTRQSKGCLVFRGVVIKDLPGDRFEVRIQIPTDNSESENASMESCVIVAYLSGKMRLNHIRILEGDQVTVEIPEQGVTHFSQILARIIARDRIIKTDLAG